MALSSGASSTQASSPPRAAMALGVAGLAPFAAGALGTLLARAPADAALFEALLLYGAVILSFMGGCRWGFRAAGLDGGDPGDRGDWRAYALAVTPSLWAFFALLAADWIGRPLVAALLAAGFVALYGADRLATQSGAAPNWWAQLRLPLTLGAASSLALVAAIHV